MTILKTWMMAATPEEQEAMARMAGTSRGMLYQVSGGFREFSAGAAGRIERATAKMHNLSNGRLPKLYRTDLAKACAQCQYAEKCLGLEAVRAEFPIVTREVVESGA